MGVGISNHSQLFMEKKPEYVRCRDMLLYVVVWSLKEAMAAKATKKRPKRAK